MVIENVQLVEEELEALELAHKQEKFDTSIPTLDTDVRDWLRRYGEPVHLFGENKGERRTRLRHLYVKNDSKPPPESETISTTAEDSKAIAADGVVEAKIEDILEDGGQTEVFYTEGDNDLLECRREFTTSSLMSALMRNNIQRAMRYGAKEEVEDAKAKERVEALMDNFGLSFSRIGSTRPISSIKYAPYPHESFSDADRDKADILASGGWSGRVCIWQGSDREFIGDINPRDNARIHALSWSPTKAVRSEPNAVLAIGSCTGSVSLHAVMVNEKEIKSKDDTIMDEGDEAAGTAEGCDKYDLKETKLCEFNTLQDRVTKVIWHPSEKHIMASSHDGTWRLYDLEKQKELLLQEGHSMEVCSLAVHPDGSLVASGDAGGVVRIWDLRTGRSIMTLNNHLRRVLSMDFHPFNGCNLLTAGEDRSALVWDVRRQLVHEKLLGHTKLISNAMYDDTGDVILTAGYDGLIKVWDSSSHSCVKSLAAHRTLIMGIDFRYRGVGSWMDRNSLPAELATGGYDRALKIWRSGG